MMRVWIERGPTNYRIMYELTPGKPVRHRSADTKRQALIIAEQLSRFIRATVVTGSVEKKQVTGQVEQKQVPCHFDAVCDDK